MGTELDPRGLLSAHPFLPSDDGGDDPYADLLPPWPRRFFMILGILGCILTLSAVVLAFYLWR